MTEQQKVALARIISDMIKADNIIEKAEISKFKELKDKYSLDNILKDARNMKFSEAVTIAKTYENRGEIFEALKEMSLADGLCVPKEALLLLALKFAMHKNTSHKVEFLSCPLSENNLCDNYIVYIENKYDERINRQIIENIEHLVTAFKSAGFDFIYIPRLIQEFKSMEESYVKDVISYMAPELSNKTIDEVYDKLSNLTTEAFCRNVLRDQLGIERISALNPSLFINIGTSLIPLSRENEFLCYTEFMCLNIEEDIEQESMLFLDEFKRYLSYQVIINTPENPGAFKYFGFYKALLDFLLVPPVGESEIVIYPQRSEIRFPKVDQTIKLTPTECATYVLMAVESNTGDMFGLCLNPDEITLKRYNKIFSSAYHATRENNSYISQILSNKARIVKKLLNLKPLKNLEKYIPVKEKNEGETYYRIKASPSLIKLWSFSQNKTYTINEFDNWKGNQ